MSERAPKENQQEQTANYQQNGLSAITENHYCGNRRNMSLAEKKAFLDAFVDKFEKRHLIEVSAIKAAYEEKVGHTIGGSQIYYLLAHHGFCKVMPRSQQPNKASEEAIEASKK